PRSARKVLQHKNANASDSDSTPENEPEKPGSQCLFSQVRKKQSGSQNYDRSDHTDKEGYDRPTLYIVRCVILRETCHLSRTSVRVRSVSRRRGWSSRIRLSGRFQIHIRVLGSLKSSNVSDDRPPIGRRDLRSVAIHLAPAVRHNIKKMTDGSIS